MRRLIEEFVGVAGQPTLKIAFIGTYLLKFWQTPPHPPSPLTMFLIASLNKTPKKYSLANIILGAPEYFVVFWVNH